MSRWKSRWKHLGLAVTYGLLALPAQAQNHTRPLPLVTVAGEATVNVAPDLAEISAGLVTPAKTAREAAEANAKGMTALIAVLRDMGLEDKDIQTARFSVQPVQSSPQSGRNEAPRIIGYQVSNRVTARIRRLDSVGDVLDRLVAAGASNISGPDFVLADPSKAADAARDAAVADARRKAEIYAKATGVALGRVFSIAEQGVAPPRPLTLRQSAVAATPIAPGEDTLRVNVTVAFELMR
jgi:uncharacterized protein YggE